MSGTTTIQVTETVFSVVLVEYCAVALLGLFCGSRSNSVRINTKLKVGCHGPHVRARL